MRQRGPAAASRARGCRHEHAAVASSRRAAEHRWASSRRGGAGGLGCAPIAMTATDRANKGSPRWKRHDHQELEASESVTDGDFDGIAAELVEDPTVLEQE